MAKITNLYERICSWENLLAAYYSAAKGGEVGLSGLARRGGVATPTRQRRPCGPRGGRVEKLVELIRLFR